MLPISRAEGLLVVDVQPAYASAIPRPLLARLLDRIRRYAAAAAPVTLFYNGPDVGGDELMDVHYFWLDAGMNDELLERVRWVEKDYGFFRGWMDAGIDDDEIVEALRLMQLRRAASSDAVDMRELEQVAPHGVRLVDSLHWPWHLERAIQPLAAWATCGGGADECLREVELFLQAKGLRFRRQDDCTYPC